MFSRPDSADNGTNSHGPVKDAEFTTLASAAVVGDRLYKHITHAIDVDETYLWSDIQTVLH